MSTKVVRRRSSPALAAGLALLAALLTASSALAAGPAPYTPPPPPDGIIPVTETFLSAGTYDGWVLESTETSNTGGTFNRLATTFNVGDNYKDRQYRAILSFNTSSLPDTAIVMAAQLNINRQGIVGTNPFTTHGQLKAVPRLGPFSADRSLQLSDFSSPPSTGATRDPFVAVTYSWYRATLSNTNLPFVNRYGLTQFRVAFALDDNDDLSDDYVKFFSGNAADPANYPQLVLTYWVP